MKKINILLILSLLISLWSCSDTDHNPWKDDIKGPDADVISPVRGTKLGDLKDGINILDENTVTFVLFAPHKEKVKLVGTFNGWNANNDNFVMEKDGDRFFLQVEGFNPIPEYMFQYLVDDEIRIADPYSTKILDPKNDKYIDEQIYPNLVQTLLGAQGEIASVFSTKQEEYTWKVEDFKLENSDNMIIYEMLLRDFTEERSLKAAQAKIPYLKELGVNVIELMPFNEFEGNQSWGYNPSFFFATDKAYGTKQAYKEFIDECHSNGIAVVMDMVLNHAFGQSPMVRLYTDDKGKISANNPWFNVEAPHDYSWGYDFNHESEYTKAFVDRVNAYWLTEFKLDGFRFDFTKGFTNKPGDGWGYDESRITILKRMTDEIRKVNEDAIIIFEHLADNSEEKVLSDYGIYLWGNMNEAFNQLTMGYDGNDLSWTSFQTRGWDNPTLIAYMESHDEARLMYKMLAYGNESGDYKVKDEETALARAGAAAVIYYAIPGPKMIWEFGELGFQERTKVPDSNDNILDPMPPYWNKMDEPGRKGLLKVYQEMGKLKNEHPAFSANNVEMSVGEGLIKQILLKSGSGNVCVVANFDVATKTVNVNFGSTGEWIEHFTGEKLNVTATNQNIELKPGEYRLYKK